MLKEWIRAERKRRGWSQEALAARAGVTQGAISHIEQDRRGTPTYETLRALAGAFGFNTVDEMLAAAGVAGAPPPDELAALLAQARRLVAMGKLNVSAELLEAIEQGAPQFPADVYANFLKGLRAELAAAEDDPTPAPVNGAQPHIRRQAGGSAAAPLVAESAAPRYEAGPDGHGREFGARVPVAGCEG